MRYRHEERTSELIKELCRKEEGIMFAENTIAKVSWSERRAAREMARWKNEIDRTYAINYAWRKGKAEGEDAGKAVGYKRAILDIARKMKQMGDSPEEIGILTDLSEKTIADL
jgi:hypothetical protein